MDFLARCGCHFKDKGVLRIRNKTKQARAGKWKQSHRGQAWHCWKCTSMRRKMKSLLQGKSHPPLQAPRCSLAKNQSHTPPIPQPWLETATAVYPFGSPLVFHQLSRPFHSSHSWQSVNGSRASLHLGATATHRILWMPHSDDSGDDSCPTAVSHNKRSHKKHK